jgi:hypothetical protein
MTSAQEVICGPFRKRSLWFFVGLGAVGAGMAVTRLAYRGRLLDVWLIVGLLLALVGIASLHWVTAWVRGDAYGMLYRTLLRRRSVPWSAVADLRVRRHAHRYGTTLRVSVALRDGRKQLLPLLYGDLSHDEDFNAKLDALRALLSRHGAPESSHLPVISNSTAGYGSWAGPLALGALLLAFAGVIAAGVPSAASEERAWRSATPCAAETPAAEREGRGREPGGECLRTLPAVIARTEANRSKQNSWLYLTESRPLERVGVPREVALEFQPGDSVELTFWRGGVVEVAGDRYVWRRHFSTAGAQAVAAAVIALTAGHPGALALLRLRGRRLPDDEVLPSALPFAAALAGTALWLLPLCYLHPTSLLTSPTAITWAAAGSSVTLGLMVWAWHATRVRTPGEVGASGETGAPGAPGGATAEGTEVFLPARFLEDTDYNPYGFGTHVVLGGGEPAVVPHPGPGRFAAKRIPVERLTVTGVRRARGEDGDTVSRSWHIAELDDAGRPVRLAAAPADLTRIIHELRRAKTPASPGPGA